MKAIKFLNIQPWFLVVFLFAITSCNDDGNGQPADLNTMDLGPFSMNLPEGWTIEEQHGYDSYVSNLITTSGEVVTFDFGLYSNPLNVDTDFHVITTAKIDGKDAKVVRPITTGNGVTGVFFAHVGNNNRFQMSGSNLSKSSEKRLLESFTSLRFK